MYTKERLLGCKENTMYSLSNTGGKYDYAHLAISFHPEAAMKAGATQLWMASQGSRV